MLAFLLIFLAALIVAMAATPVARRLALVSGMVAIPNARRAHQTPTPLLGGIAIYLGCAIALILFSDRFYVSQLIGIFIGATFVSFLGLWDDRRDLPPLAKLAGQVFGALVLVWTGIRIEVFPSTAVDVGLTLVWIVGITNAMNLVDNMDGLLGGVATVASAFFLVLAAQSGQFLVASLAAALLGACLGFLYYNFNPASIFMGDSGSLFIGYVLAAVGIKLKFDNTDLVTWMIPVLILGLPIFDTTLVVISRLRRHTNPLVGGKDHLSHRLVRLGWTHREAVMALYLVCGALGVVSMMLVTATMVEAYVVGGIIFAVALLALIKLETLAEPRSETRTP
ncbi:MAG TPA: MraY family glycosyltransferase [Chloroflexota bacterium]|nr:MraY family glycosyltransferase [Chloroflexota bacterium]